MSGYTIQIADYFPTVPFLTDNPHTWIIVTAPDGTTHTYGFGPVNETGVTIAGPGTVYIDQKLHDPTNLSGTYTISNDQYNSLMNFINAQAAAPPYYNALRGEECTVWALTAINATYGQNPFASTWSLPSELVGQFSDFLTTLRFNPLDDPFTGPSVVSTIWKEIITHSLPSWMQPLFRAYEAAIALSAHSPLVLDLNGNGIDLSATGAMPVYFNENNNTAGFVQATAWVNPTDGFLAMDRNGNGMIDSQSEFFGFDSLAQLDSYGDGKITSADARFNDLRVWVDANQDGISQASELFTLPQLGITSINLTNTYENYDINGNRVSAQSTFTINGKTNTIVDAWLNYDSVNSVYRGSYTLNPQALLLPQMRGYGLLPDLMIAMSQNAALLAAVQQFAALDVVARPDLVADRVKQIMYLWAGVQNVDPKSRGGSDFNFDARNVSFVEQYFGQLASDTAGGFLGLRGAPIDTIFYGLEEKILARLMIQSGGQVFFSTVPTYNAITDSFTGNYAFNMTAINNAMSGKSIGAITQQWFNIFSMVDGAIGLGNLSAVNKAALSNAIAASDPTGSLNFNGLAQLVANNITSDGFNFITGTAGNDNFNINSGNNLILGMGGNDTFNITNFGVQKILAGSSNDTFVVTGLLAAGSLLSGGGGTNVLRALGNISAVGISDIQEVDVYGNVTVTATQLGGFAKVVDESMNGVGSLIAASGAGTYDLTKEQTVGIFNLQGSATGDDTLIGNAKTQVIQAGGGNDLMYAGLGSTVTFKASYIVGRDEMYGAAGNDTFQIDATLAAGSIIDGGGGTNVLQTDGADFSKVSVSRIQEVDIAGNVTLTASQLAGFSKVVDSNYALYGYNSYATITAGGAGTYDLRKAQTTGIINLQGSATGDDSLIGNATTQTITAGGGNDLMYAGSDNSITFIAANPSGRDEMYGAAGNDIFQIYYGTLAAGSILDGGGGNNVLQTNADVSKISSISHIQEVDVLGSITLTATQMAGFSKIVDKAGGSWIYTTSAGIYDLNKAGVSGVFNLQGSTANGEVLKGNALTQYIYTGSGSNIIYSGSGNETIEIGSGNNIVYGNIGNDRFNAYSGGLQKIYGGAGNELFNIGSLTMGSIIDGGGGSNILLTGADISNLQISHIQELDVAGYTALTASQMSGFGKIVDKTGSSWIYASGAGTFDLTRKNVTGVINFQSTGTGDQVLIGNANTQSINAGAGNDTISASGAHTLYGNDGNDTFLMGVAPAFAGEIIDGGAGNNTLMSSHADLTQAKITHVQNLQINGGVTLTAAELASFSQVTDIQIGPGGSWVIASGSGTYDVSKAVGYLNIWGDGNDTLIGNGAAETFYTNAGNDIVDGGGGGSNPYGGDLFYGGTGNDTYMFARGYGTNAINQLNTGAAGDVLQLKSGVARDQLWFTQSGSDLLVQIIGTNDKMTINGWYNGTNNDQVGQIQTSDGHMLTITKVQNLVNAMASLTLPATTTLSQSYHTQLDPVIAASWT